ncbi:retrovirus-related Pol polyprotein from transposon 412 [Trichonephila clavipes]|nr:retrovirus-related Pol polyprotein from transposon 412 [Trichonephila clavipes]
MDELNNKLTANKEELKSDLKGIGDKLTTMDKKFEEMEGRIESVENKFEDMESKLEAKIFEKGRRSFHLPSIKLSTYDGKSSWQVYKDPILHSGGCKPVGLPDQGLPRLDFDALVNALELRFGEMCEGSRLQLKSRQQKVSETLRTGDGRREASHLAFSDCPTEVRSPGAATLHRRVRDPEIQKALRMADLKDLKALVFAMRFGGAAQQATRGDRHPMRAVNESDTSNSIDSYLLENAELSKRLFQEFEDVFSRNSSDIGHTTVTQHRIDTADHPPIKQHPRRLPFAKQEEVGTLLREMQENDITVFESVGISIVLVPSQEIDGQERVVAYWSKCLSKPERIIVSSKKAGYCESRSLLTSRHRKGSSHGNADALSRKGIVVIVSRDRDYAIRQITTSTATPPDPWVTVPQMADPDIKPCKSLWR